MVDGIAKLTIEMPFNKKRTYKMLCASIGTSMRQETLKNIDKFIQEHKHLLPEKEQNYV